jgi:hypothetical protein
MADEMRHNYGRAQTKIEYMLAERRTATMGGWTTKDDLRPTGVCHLTREKETKGILVYERDQEALGYT